MVLEVLSKAEEQRVSRVSPVSVTPTLEEELSNLCQLIATTRRVAQDKLGQTLTVLENLKDDDHERICIPAVQSPSGDATHRCPLCPSSDVRSDFPDTFSLSDRELTLRGLLDVCDIREAQAVIYQKALAEDSTLKWSLKITVFCQSHLIYFNQKLKDISSLEI